MTALDWSAIAAYFAVSLGIGIYYTRRARGSTTEFFLSGRDVPWWLAGTSMVATTFAADTPLAVTGIVARNGIAGNWLWWNFVMSGMLTVFFYARLWRRSGVMTDVEFAELRYSGKPAAFLRGFRALYLGIPINCIVIGWVNLAMAKILMTTLGVDHGTSMMILGGLLVFTAFYTTLSGLWGTLVTDFFQFGLAMAMVVILAVYSVDAVGGIAALKAKLLTLDAAAHAANATAVSHLDFLPASGSVWMPLITLLTYLAVNWWATWYPGAEPGGGGYVAQRIFSARNERHGLFATLWFNVAHYTLRTWPWILTGLATVVLYPTLVDKESGYVKAIMDPHVFPPALHGLMLAAFLAAYMSTISTQLNWGASYIINDVYRRFWVRHGSERNYVIASQIVTGVLMILSLIVTLNLDTIGGAWKLLIVTGAGTGTVLLLRWYWWRINAWSEVAAMVVAAIVSLYLQIGIGWNTDDPKQFAYVMLITVAVTTVAWIAVTYLTRPEPEERLLEFYRRALPAGPGWSKVVRSAGLPPSRDRIGAQLANWVAGCALIYSAMFGAGKWILQERAEGAILLGVALLAAAYLGWSLREQESGRADPDGVGARLLGSQQIDAEEAP